MTKQFITYLFFTAYASAFCMEKPAAIAPTLAQSDDEYLARSLIRAILNNEKEQIQPLLDKKVDLNASLRYAVESSIAKSCKALMLLGANPYSRGPEGKNAFDCLRDTWSYTNEIKQILKEEDTWYGWIISKMRSIRTCCRHNKEEKTE